MISTWKEYTEACLRTAIYPPEHRITYPALGLVSEAGEVAGKFKKYLRDGGELPREALLDELGDVCWYCAVLAHELGWRLPGDVLDDRGTMLHPIEVSIAIMTRHAASASEEALDMAIDGSPGDGAQYTGWVVDFVYDIAVALGSSLPEVLERNIAKLASRGVIGGSGDTR